MTNKKAYHHWEERASTLEKTFPWNGVIKRGSSRPMWLRGTISEIFGMRFSLVVHYTTVKWDEIWLADVNASQRFCPYFHWLFPDFHHIKTFGDAPGPPASYTSGNRPLNLVNHQIATRGCFRPRWRPLLYMNTT